MNPVRLLLVLVEDVSSLFAVPYQISPVCLWCFSSIHTVLVTLLLGHGYKLTCIRDQKLLPEISEFSTNVQE